MRLRHLYKYMLILNRDFGERKMSRGLILIRVDQDFLNLSI